MTRRDLKWFVAGATAIVLVIMADGYRRLRQLNETIDEVWSNASDGLQGVQEPSEESPWGSILSHWTADVFANDSKGNRTNR